MPHPYWPLLDLEVRTPILTLRYIDDALADELATLISQPIHDPAEMPFGVAWTDAPEPTRQREAYRFWARSRAHTTAESWNINLAIQRHGRAIGACSLMAEQFPTLRTFETGSWITQSEQGHGYGTEMRAALLHLGFAGLGATEATTAAFADNPRSLGVTRRHGYEPNGTKRMLRRGEAADLLRFRLGREEWAASRRDDIELVGVEGVRDLLGIDTP